MGRTADIKRVLAKNVRRLRKAKGLSQSALAIEAGQHQYLISKIENAQLNVKIENIGKIARALDVNPRDLCEE